MTIEIDSSKIDWVTCTRKYAAEHRIKYFIRTKTCEYCNSNRVVRIDSTYECYDCVIKTDFKASKASVDSKLNKNMRILKDDPFYNLGVGVKYRSAVKTAKVYGDQLRNGL